MKARNLLFGALAAAGVSGLVLAVLRYGMTMTTLLLIVISLLVVAIAGLAASAMKARRKPAGGIEGALKAQSEREAASFAPDRRAEIERMQESFDEAVARLKASSLGGEGKFGRFGKGKQALYALPWYLVVGPPGAGKTTALLQSGLRFPAGAERVRGVGGTRNCDWFFTDQAILLDTAGRYTTEDEDRDEWHAFLEALRESRPDRPINGVVVGIAAQDLLGDERDLEDHADNIRRRINELVAQLGLGLPVYLVVTKTDLVPGFVDVFGELDRAGREQVWGATVEPHATADPRAVVEREFDTLLEALKPHRDARLARDLRREERRRVYSFPLEFGALKDRLATFAGLVFATDPLADGPLFRGFYFTSGTQEGAPIDRVIGALAEQFGLKTPPPPRPPAEPKSYFLKGVFTDVVFPDRFLARRTKKAAGATWRAMTRTGLAALGVAAIAATVLGFAGARSGLDLRRVVDRAENARGATFHADGARTSEVQRLEGLRVEVDRLTSPRPLSRALRLGLDRGDTVREPAARLYYGIARDLVNVYAMRQLRASLERARRFDEPDTTLAPGERTASRRAAQRVDIENDLEAYLLLTTHADSLGTSEYLRDALKTRLAELAPRGALGDQPADREAMTDLVVRQTDAFVDGLAAGLAEPFEPDRALIAAAVDVVDVPPTLDGLYQRIRREALARLAPLGLRNAVPDEYLGLFAPAGTVPGFFTRDGWDRVVRRRFREAAANPANEYWALGRTAADLPPELRDPDAVYDALMTRYQAEYVTSWTRFLQSVRYKPADGAEAESRLAILGSPTDSPIGWLLAVVTEQTSLPPEDTAPRSRGLLDRAASAVGMGDDDATAADTVDVVRAAFAGIHRLGAPGLQAGEASDGLYQALEALAQFGRRIGGAAGDPGLANELLATTKDEIEQGTRGMDRQTRQNLFFSPLDITTTLTVDRVTGEAADAEAAATAAAEAAAVEEAADAYTEQIAGRYPFAPRSSRDAALDDARAFFGPGGDIDKLAQAIGPDGGSPALRRAIEKGQRIGRALAGDITFRLRPDLPEYSSEAAQRELGVDAVAFGAHGANTVYRLGSRRWEDLRWPGAPSAYVTIQRAGGPLTLDAEGDWAVFRLLQQATIRPLGSTNYDVRWTFREGGHTVTARYEMRTTSENSPLADVGSFFQFSLPR